MNANGRGKDKRPRAPVDWTRCDDCGGSAVSAFCPTHGRVHRHGMAHLPAPGTFTIVSMNLCGECLEAHRARAATVAGHTLAIR